MGRRPGVSRQGGEFRVLRNAVRQCAERRLVRVKIMPKSASLVADFGQEGDGSVSRRLLEDRLIASEGSKTLHERNLLVVESVGVISFIHQKADTPFTGDLGLSNIEIFCEFPSTDLEIGGYLNPFQAADVIGETGFLMGDGLRMAEVHKEKRKNRTCDECQGAEPTRADCYRVLHM